MSDINEKFEQAAVKAKSLPAKPDNDTLLQMYALYKQGSAGDVSGTKPGMFDFVAAAKYGAWEKLQGMDSDEAKQKYIELVEKLSA